MSSTGCFITITVVAVSGSSRSSTGWEPPVVVQAASAAATVKMAILLSFIAILVSGSRVTLYSIEPKV